MENAALVGAVVNVVGLAIAAIVGIPWLREAIDASQTRIYDLPPNNDEVAEQDCLDLLRNAKSSIVMYDDGDTDKGSLYQSERVVQVIEDKITSNPEFKVECVLNNAAGKTLFEKRLGKRVSIRQRTSNQSRIHYRIIDQNKGVVSCHGIGEADRNRKLIDCTDVPARRGRPPLALRRYLDDFYSHA